MLNNTIKLHAKYFNWIKSSLNNKKINTKTIQLLNELCYVDGKYSIEYGIWNIVFNVKNCELNGNVWSYCYGSQGNIIYQKISSYISNALHGVEVVTHNFSGEKFNHIQHFRSGLLHGYESFDNTKCYWSFNEKILWNEKETIPFINKIQENRLEMCYENSSIKLFGNICYILSNELKFEILKKLMISDPIY